MAARRSQFPPFPLVAGISVPQSDLSREKQFVLQLERLSGTQCKEQRCMAMQGPSRRKESWEYSLPPAQLRQLGSRGQDLLGRLVLDGEDMRSRGHRRESLL